MSVVGWLTRTVGDAALLYDLTRGASPVDRDRAPDPPRPFVEAAAADPGRLRVAASFAHPLGPPPAALHDELRRAVLDTAEALRSLGHDVVERDPDLKGPEGWAATVRVLRGIADEALSLPRFDRLDRRWRRVARLGSAIPDSLIERARAAEASAVARLRPFFEAHDVLLSPVQPTLPLQTGRWEGRGALWTINGAGRFVPYTVPWNFTGQPAAAVPVGLSAAGLPLAVQLVGRPDDEGTILSLAAQLEGARPWADRRPPVS
jgi:amidase